MFLSTLFRSEKRSDFQHMTSSMWVFFMNACHNKIHGKDVADTDHGGTPVNDEKQNEDDSNGDPTNENNATSWLIKIEICFFSFDD